MIIKRANYVKGNRIEDVWRDLLWLTVRKGHDFVVEGGSYIGQIRKQLDRVCFYIKTPGKRPLAPLMTGGRQAPTSDEKVEMYFANYLMDTELAENEQYKYATYIVPQLPDVIKLLIDSRGNTNQACISVGDANSTKLPDPPCLRVMSFKVVRGKLNCSVFFRSWDLFAGLPENIGGFQLIKEYVLSFLIDAGLKVEDGAIIGYSDGLHIYEQYFELVDGLTVDNKIHIDPKALKDQAEFLKSEAYQKILATQSM